MQLKSSNILLSVRKFITSDMIPCRLFIEIVGFANVEKNKKVRSVNSQYDFFLDFETKK